MAGIGAASMTVLSLDGTISSIDPRKGIGMPYSPYPGDLERMGASWYSLASLLLLPCALVPSSFIYLYDVTTSLYSLSSLGPGAVGDNRKDAHTDDRGT